MPQMRRLGRVAGHLVTAPTAAAKFVPGAAKEAPAPALTTLSALGDSTEAVSFPKTDAPTVLLFVAADCPVCGEVFTALAQLRDTLQSKAAVHMISQDEEMLELEHDMNKRLARGVFLPHHTDIAFPVLNDSRLVASLRWTPEVLPALVLVDAAGAELSRVEGWVRDEWEAAVGEVASTLGAALPPVEWADLPVKLEGCGSKHGFLDDTGGGAFFCCFLLFSCCFSAVFVLKMMNLRKAYSSSCE